MFALPSAKKTELFLLLFNYVMLKLMTYCCFCLYECTKIKGLVLLFADGLYVTYLSG